jgi:hypothetical protein
MQAKPLKESHIIPSYVGKYFKETSVTGRIRMLGKPNLAQQDIHKANLFCGDCEQLMGEDDKYFAENIFVPVHESGLMIRDYDYRLGRFCAMQSFRTMAYIDRALNDLYVYNDRLNKLIGESYDYLRNFVLQKRKNPKSYNQYMVIFDVIQNIGEAVPDPPDHINKYLVRTVDLDIVTNKSNIAFIYSKLCKIALMTFLAPKNPKGLESARIYGGWGRFPESHEIDFDGFADFLFDRASHFDSYFEGLSPKQKENIRKRIEANTHRIFGSETSRASRADQEMREIKKQRKS